MKEKQLQPEVKSIAYVCMYTLIHTNDSDKVHQDNPKQHKYYNIYREHVTTHQAISS